MQRSRLYRDGKLEQIDFPLEDVKIYKKSKNQFFWIDLVAPREEELDLLGKELNLSALALEDAFRGKQRPKLDHYQSHIFINAYTANFSREDRELRSEEIAIFVTSNGLITVRDNEDFDISALIRRWDESIELSHAGATYLLWGLLDSIVDGYFEAVEQLDLEIEALEEVMFASKRIEVAIQERTYALRKALVILRRLAVPMREVINPLVRAESALINRQILAYFQDIYDHVMRVADWTESLRDLVTTLLETNLTIQSNNMNMIMKKVTSWAAIIAVPTAITGFYGQNVPYPGFGEVGGFWVSTAAIILISGALYWSFRKNDWL